MTKSYLYLDLKDSFLQIFAFLLSQTLGQSWLNVSSAYFVNWKSKQIKQNCKQITCDIKLFHQKGEKYLSPYFCFHADDMPELGTVKWSRNAVLLQKLLVTTWYLCKDIVMINQVKKRSVSCHEPKMVKWKKILDLNWLLQANAWYTT